ncbi:MAG: hypothetical protein NTU44_01830 [Bacteroidetes bacterium]|nr:hypothetical protein [Bacteroidota bacterium]
MTKKINSRYLLLSFLALGILLQSCNVAYHPAQQNVPLISDKTEGTASFSGSNIQGAGALGGSTALMCNFQYSAFLSGLSDDNEGVFNKPPSQWNLEVAPGIYKTLAPKVVFEFYGGAGIGGSNVYGESSLERYHANHYRLFLQPDIGYKGDKWEVAFSTRLLRLQFFNERIHNLDTDWLKDNDVYHLDRYWYFFAEPALTIRMKLKGGAFAFSQFIYSEMMNRDPLSRSKATLIVGFCGRF